MTDFPMNEKAVCAALFLFGKKSEVTFESPERVGKEAKAAIDSLVGKGVVEVMEPGREAWLKYRGTDKARELGMSMTDVPREDWPAFPITIGCGFEKVKGTEN